MSERSACLRGDIVQLRRSVNGQRAANDERLASTREAKRKSDRRNARDGTRISLRSIADDGDGDVVQLARWCMSMHVRRAREKVAE